MNLRTTAVAVAIAGIVGAGLVACDDTEGGTGCQWNADHTTCEPAPAPYDSPYYGGGYYGTPGCCGFGAGAPGAGGVTNGYGGNGSAGNTQGGG